ncbi:amidohydrolase family protein [Shewanella submarina]|uniref:Amidohydrolase family protein n=1 Tax=Shewanella submarina TaxID=2016376 RepID=A0ABV7GK97_9GAMM|nr:amidohydrolase family protein [Shewanella submarina]MCL1036396.1 amidohydrolase family protein [Shewanella submarina]
MRVLAMMTGLLMASPALAHDMVPGAPQSQPILLQNALVHTVSVGSLEDTDILIENGIITAVGSDLQADGAQVIDLTGKQVYPGLIALNTFLGLTEISMVRATVDTAEVGKLNPEVKASVAFNPDSELIPTVRSNGITHVQVVPQGRGLTGQSTLVNLDSWTIVDGEVDTPAAIHLHWPTVWRWSSDEKRRKKQQEQLDADIQTIHSAFEDAYRYHLAAKADKVTSSDIRWQAMLPLFSGEAKLFAHADNQGDIEQILDIARHYNIKPVIVGGYDAWRMPEMLSEAGASVIYPHVFSLPRRSDEPIDLPFRIPAMLEQADIPFAFGFRADWDARNLPFAAGQSISYGLNKQDALKAVTLDAARIMGANKMGSIAPGYKASLIISSGDIFNPMEANIEAMYIDGRQVDLNNRHRQLYQKYLKR